MTKFILGTKEKMTQVFTDDGSVVPVTIVSAGPMVVMQVKNEERDGYRAVQVGYGTQKKERLNKPERGHQKGKAFRYLREFRLSETEEDGEPKEGDEIKADIFKKGDMVRVSAVSKGKGFQGVVKRHGFKGGPRTHGQKHSEREPGSIAATGPQRVFKGTRMPGRMGGDRVTVENVTIEHVDPETGRLYIKGAVPGRTGTLVEIREE